MADFDLTQTDAQVQSILNDAQDAQGAGAQTTLTNDYIMLKGTNGRYHKIQKESFTEAVRNTLASLLVNNDKGTTISQIAAIASGDFGSVTPANLASVLGVGESGYLSQNQSLTLERGTVWCFSKSAAQVLFFIKPGYDEQYTVVLSPNQVYTTETSIIYNSSDRTTTVTNLKIGNLVYKRVS